MFSSFSIYLRVQFENWVSVKSPLLSFCSGVQIAQVSRHFDKGCTARSELIVIVTSKTQLVGLLDLCGAWASSEHSDDSQSSPEWSGVKETIDPSWGGPTSIVLRTNDTFFVSSSRVFPSPYQWPIRCMRKSTQQSEARWLARDGDGKHKLLCLKSYFCSIYSISTPLCLVWSKWHWRKKLRSIRVFVSCLCINYSCSSGLFPRQSHLIKFVSGLCS